MRGLFDVNLFSFLVLTASDIVYKAEDETVTFKFPHKLPVGNAQLEIVFVGELNDKMKGFYRSKYTSLSGEERFCAVTQFEVSFFFHHSQKCTAP